MNEAARPLVGGLFGLADSTPSSNGTLPFRERHWGFANARSALAFLIDAFRPKRVWLPSFVCSVVPETVQAKGVGLAYFEVGPDLVTGRDWLGRVERGDFAVLVDYFGFPFDRGIAQAARERGAWVVEDAAQALYGVDFERGAHFAILSPRKFVGVPDGGILLLAPGTPLPVEPKLEPAPADWWRAALEAATLRRRFDEGGGDRRWFETFQAVEASQPVGPYSMSDVAWRALASVDHRAATARRIENYGVLLDRLPGVALFPRLQPGVVPLGFPVRVPRRDEARKRLFAADIYPPVHWPLHGFVPEGFAASHRLAAEIMTLPCDQRYGAADMERMASLLLAEPSA